MKKIILSIILVLVLFIGYYKLLTFFVVKCDEQGQFGDMFGALNAFFTGMAFLGVIYSIIQQNQIIEQNSKQIQQNELEYKTDLRINALSTLININQNKYSQIKDINHIEANQLQKKIISLTEELEDIGYEIINIESNTGEIHNENIKVISLKKLLDKTFECKWTDPN